jgi:esterase
LNHYFWRMKLFFREYGSGNPMVILHGLLGSSDNWMPQAKLLGEHYHVYVVDQRNHGQSPHSAEHTYEVMVSDLRQFIKDHELNKPVIIGHSMGGKTAMNFALSDPDNLSALIVVDIAPRAYDVRHDHIIEGLKAIPINSIQSRNEADEELSHHIGNLVVRQFLLKNLMRKPEGGFSWRMNLGAIDQNLERIGEAIDTGKTFTNPTLFVRGTRSDYIQDEDRDLIKDIFPNAKLVSMDTGHWVHAEKPVEFVNAVLSFLNSLK